MRLTRVHVATPLSSGAALEIHGAAANHLRRVLRLREGDEVTLFDGRGGEYPSRIEGFRKESVAVTVGEQRPIERESTLEITLAQGISRGERMDLVVQKATELGVTRIQPIFTERSVVRLDASQVEKKLAHWTGIVVAACEQCGRNRLPRIDSPQDLDDFLMTAHGDSAVNLVLSPTASAGPRSLAGTKALRILIGPEGGLTEREEALAAARGFRAVALGPRILRTETAAIAALAALQAIAGDLGAA